MYSAKKKGIETSYNLFYRVARGVKGVTVKKLVNQIDFVQGKAKLCSKRPHWLMTAS